MWIPAPFLLLICLCAFLDGCTCNDATNVGASIIASGAGEPEPPMANSIRGISTVRVVFMNHLDVGFDGIDPTIGFAVNVIAKYFNEYFPKAVNTAIEMRKFYPSKDGDRFIYTTDAWLVDLYVDPDCPNRGVPSVTDPINGTVLKVPCPSEKERIAFEQAIRRGDIAWHAYPFNVEAELAYPSLYGSGVRLCRRLAEKYGLPPVSTVSQRDVPGITRGSIPVLRKHGVKAISVGVNGASAPPAVPNPFVWKDESSGESMLAMWHPGGYGGINVSDCVMAEGLPTALAFAFRGDNKGPQNVTEVEKVYQQIRSEFGKDTKVVASTFDQFVDELETVRDRLPVVRSEIGDTWIYGTPSDPLKLAWMRETMRLRRDCVARGEDGCDPSSTHFERFDFLLLKTIEHTWGLDVKTFLHDWTNWTNTLFHQAEDGVNYEIMRTSWEEQRAYLHNAVEQLGDIPLASRIKKALAEIGAPVPPTPSSLEADGYTRVAHWDPSTTFECAGPIPMRWRMNDQGALDMYDVGSLSLASSNRTLGLFSYHTYEASNYSTFLGEYLYEQNTSWAPKDFGKYNLTNSASPIHTSHPAVREVYWNAARCSVVSRMVMPTSLHTQAGSPSALWSEWKASKSSDGGASGGDDGVGGLEYSLLWTNKTSTRLPEAAFVQFNPKCPSACGWRWTFDKMGSLIDPLDVVVNGSHHLHGINRGVRFGAPDGPGVWMDSRDAGVACAGQQSAFPTPLSPPPSLKQHGTSFLLVDNLWGTNYIMWYPWKEEDANARFRFSISVEKG